VLILPRQAGRVSVFWLTVGSEVLGWDALGAVQKYGPQEWSGWEFRARARAEEQRRRRGALRLT